MLLHLVHGMSIFLTFVYKMLDEESSALVPLPLLGLQGVPVAALGDNTPWQDITLCHAKVDCGAAKHHCFCAGK